MPYGLLAASRDSRAPEILEDEESAMPSLSGGPRLSSVALVLLGLGIFGSLAAGPMKMRRMRSSHTTNFEANETLPRPFKCLFELYL